MKRRDFVKTAVLASASLAVGIRSHAAEEKPAAAPKLPQRPYGKTGVKLSIIGFPGLVLSRVSQDEANRLVSESVERGVNYFDVAPAYGDAEVKLGPPLEPHRKNVFLACKTKQRDRKGAEAEFERSLKRLRTDHFDLYQLHCLQSVPRDVEPAFAKDGVMGYLVEQQKAGRIRYLGFSAHTEEAALAAMERFAFDSVLFPVNFGSCLKANFGPRVVADAAKRGVTVLAMKGLCRQRWDRNDPMRRRFRMWYRPVSDRAEADLALRYTLSQAVCSAVPPSNAFVHRLALDLGPGVKPIAEPEVEKLRALAKTLTPVFPQRRRS